MNKFILPIIAALAVTTFAAAEDTATTQSSQATITFPSMTTDEIRSLLNKLDADRIGAIVDINRQSPGKITVVSCDKLDNALSDDDGSMYEYEIIDGNWTLIGKTHIRRH
ncbi:MAG: 3-deoxy-7-phosphoheptulonate synthase [Syntrophomonadaceae bacterium]|jgi:hypothetical protein|nr:hypothetical protein [Chromatiaceae bacterium]NLP24583.1 3-deoxy-7-phosphoheptulonate synthase [Syntrophomonadaceae bacterium]